MEIIGRLTADATVKIIRNERQVVNFTIALNDYYKSKGNAEGTKITTYLQCAYWISSSIAGQLTKGTLVELYGRIGVNAYMGRDGEAKANLTFHVNNIKLHGKPKSQINSTQPAPSLTKEEASDGLPF